MTGKVTNAQFCKFLNEKGNQKEEGTTWLIDKEGRVFIKKSTKEVKKV